MKNNSKKLSGTFATIVLICLAFGITGFFAVSFLLIVFSIDTSTYKVQNDLSHSVNIIYFVENRDGSILDYGTKFLGPSQTASITMTEKTPLYLEIQSGKDGETVTEYRCFDKYTLLKSYDDNLLKAIFEVWKGEGAVYQTSLSVQTPLQNPTGFNADKIQTTCSGN